MSEKEDDLATGLLLYGQVPVLIDIARRDLVTWERFE